MKFIGFDGQHYTVEAKKYISKTRSNASKLHKSARELLKTHFPSSLILEEMPLAGSRQRGNGLLFADYYLPQASTVVEVHGKQHFEFVKHFHGSVQAFRYNQKLDKIKEEWCIMNNIYYVPLPYNKDWEEILNEFNSRRNPIH